MALLWSALCEFVKAPQKIQVQAKSSYLTGKRESGVLPCRVYYEYPDTEAALVTCEIY